MKTKSKVKKNKDRVLFSIDPDCLELFINCYKDENRSKMVEAWMHQMIQAKLKEDQK